MTGQALTAVQGDVSPLGAPDRQAVHDLFARHPHPTPLQYRGVPWRTTASFLATSLVEYTQARLPTIAFGARNGVLAGVGSLEQRPWESELYGRRLAWIPILRAAGESGSAAAPVLDALLDRLLSEARSARNDHVICRIVSDDLAATHALERAGFLLMDTTLELTWDVKRLAIEDRPNAWSVAELGRGNLRIPKFGVHFRPALASDIPVLTGFASEAFTDRMPMHFAANTELPREGTAQLYAQWIEKAIQGSFADIVRVAADDNGPIGVLTFKRNRDLSKVAGLEVGDMGLAVVSERATGKGVLPGLLLAVLQQGGLDGLDIVRGRVHVVNYAMQRGCLITGGVITAALHTYHANLRTAQAG